MIRIISDSTSDLPQELVEKYGISILPLHIIMGDREYEDMTEIGPDEIFAWSDENHTTPRTSAPSIEAAEALMKPFLDQGDELICFAISFSMSSSGNTMRLAAEELDAEDRVTVIDSANLSSGIALMVVEAAIMAQNGRSRQEIVDRIEAIKPLVRSSFVVDSLNYLHRSGRCGGLAALAGSALKLHPRIAVADGHMTPGKKYRGKQDMAIWSYVKDMEEELKAAVQDRVFLTHSGCKPEVIERVRQYLDDLHVFREIIINKAGGLISSHCGPNCLGVLFIAKEN